jgi:hypothetical protein
VPAIEQAVGEATGRVAERVVVELDERPGLRLGDPVDLVTSGHESWSGRMHPPIPAPTPPLLDQQTTH